VTVPASRGDLVARLRQAGSILHEEYQGDSVEIVALVPEKLAGQVRKAVGG